MSEFSFIPFKSKLSSPQFQKTGNNVAKYKEKEKASIIPLFKEKRRGRLLKFIV